MTDSLNEDQTKILIKSLIEAINTKNGEIELIESYANMLGDVINRLNDEIASLKTKLKVKANKAPKVTKEPKVIAPAKRKPGRPKKVAA